MTTIKNFAAQQLTKKQMNGIKGGTLYMGCTIRNSDGKVVEYVRAVMGETKDELYQNMAFTLEPGQKATDCKYL